MRCMLTSAGAWHVALCSPDFLSGWRGRSQNVNMTNAAKPIRQKNGVLWQRVLLGTHLLYRVLTIFSVLYKDRRLTIDAEWNQESVRSVHQRKYQREWKLKQRKLEMRKKLARQRRRRRQKRKQHQTRPRRQRSSVRLPPGTHGIYCVGFGDYHTPTERSHLYHGL